MDDVVIARKAAVEGERPPGLEPVGCKQPHPNPRLGRYRIRDIDLWHVEERVIEVGAAQEEIISEPALHLDQRGAQGDVAPFQSREPRRVEEDRRAVGAGGGRRGPAARHRAGVLLVDAEPLGSEHRGTSHDDEPRVPGKPLHTDVSGKLKDGMVEEARIR